MKEILCPCCGGDLNQAERIGHIYVCWYCSSWLHYDGDIKVYQEKDDKVPTTIKAYEVRKMYRDGIIDRATFQEACRTIGYNQYTIGLLTALKGHI